MPKARKKRPFTDAEIARAHGLPVKRRTLDDVEKLDRKFKRQCAARAREERANARASRRNKQDIAAAYSEVRAAVYDELALQGFAVMDD